MPIKLILILAFALLVALFAVQNAQAIAINFLGFNLPEVPLSAVIIGMLSLGVLLGVLFSVPGMLSRSRKMRELETELKKRNEELAKRELEIKELLEKHTTKNAEVVG